MVHVYELDDTTGAYVPTSIERKRLQLVDPFGIDIEVDRLVR
ncbi:hypothetical protein [Sphaerisporangium dianthi]|uniref:Restriction endonuclease domain-containing protein n=1 Tax=Sphaerisporangium dianthi TaxID=1436120 RepID=A0ABV9CSV7_9ACTN